MGEVASAQGEYREPSPSDFQIIETEQLGIRALANLKATYRISRIDDEDVTWEPRQADVLRYPPVQVGIERDAKEIEAYVKMPPTDLSFWHGDKATE